MDRKKISIVQLSVILIAPLPWKIHKCMEVGVVCNVIGVGSEVTDQRMEVSGRTQKLSTVKNKKGKKKRVTTNKKMKQYLFIPITTAVGIGGNKYWFMFSLGATPTFNF